MSAQKKKPDEEHDEQGTTERIWDATVKTFHNATFKANQYRRIVQKKIDLNAIQKKITEAHTDLGKMIDDLHEAGEKAILSKPDVKAMLSQIDSLKHTASTLIGEIEEIRAEEEPPEQDEADKSVN